LAIQSGIPENHVFVAENGTVVEADENGVRLGERVPGGYVFVDGSGVGDVGRIVIRDREILARDGFMIVVVNVDTQTGKLLDEPEIISRGFIYLRDADELLEQVRETVVQTLESVPTSLNGKRRERVQESVSRFLYNETKRRPMVFSIINEY
jgi:ribonuclease J